MKTMKKVIAAIVAGAFAASGVSLSGLAETASATSLGVAGTIFADSIELSLQELEANDYYVEIPLTSDIMVYTFGVGASFDEGLEYVGSSRDSFPTAAEGNRLWTGGYFMNGCKAGKTLQSFYFKVDENAQPGDTFDIELTIMNFNGEIGAVLNESIPEVVDGEISITPYLRGDVNLDGVVDTEDAFCVLWEYAQQSLTHSGTLTDLQLWIADVNEDDEVDAQDAAYIMIYYAQACLYGKADWDDVLAM